MNAVLNRRSASRTDLEKLRGSLRHVASCVRPARAFYQTLHRVYRQFPSFGHRTLSRPALADLECFQAILQVAHLVDIPTSVFCRVSTPTIIFQMDASDEAIAVIDVTNRRYIQMEFNERERYMIAALAKAENRELALAAISLHYPDLKTVDEFSINVREHFAIVLAVCLWGPSFATALVTTHIGVLSDNTAAISWSNSLSSPNKFSQNLNRVLAVVCARFRLEVSAQHIKGCENIVPGRVQAQIICAHFGSMQRGTGHPTQYRPSYARRTWPSTAPNCSAGCRLLAQIPRNLARLVSFQHCQQHQPMATSRCNTAFKCPQSLGLPPLQ